MKKYTPLFQHMAHEIKFACMHLHYMTTWNIITWSLLWLILRNLSSPPPSPVHILPLARDWFCRRKADPGRSIPKGTLAAIGFVTATYLVFVWMFGTILSNDVLIADKLVASRVAWPTHYLVSVGDFFFFSLQCFGGEGCPFLCGLKGFLFYILYILYIISYVSFLINGRNIMLQGVTCESRAVGEGRLHTRRR